MGISSNLMVRPTLLALGSKAPIRCSIVDGADQAEEGYDGILGDKADAANAIFEARADIHLGLHRHRHAGSMDGSRLRARPIVPALRRAILRPARVLQRALHSGVVCRWHGYSSITPSANPFCTP
jgi:hypothetical protein